MSARISIFTPHRSSRPRTGECADSIPAQTCQYFEMRVQDKQSWDAAMQWRRGLSFVAKLLARLDFRSQLLRVDRGLFALSEEQAR